MKESCLIVIEEGFTAGELSAMSNCCRTGQANVR
jgi:hypothetical protein